MLGVLLLAALGVLQWYLARRFHRILNPGVLAATVCALLAVLLGAQALSASAEHLRGARRGALEPVVALSRAARSRTTPNADESRYLLDPERREQYGQTFLAKSQELPALPRRPSARTPTKSPRPGRHIAPTTTTCASPASSGANSTTSPSPGSGRRRRRPSRRTPPTSVTTARSARWWRRARSARPSRSASAWEPGMSNAHFGAWMNALTKSTDINRHHFTASVRAGRAEVTGLLPWALGALLAAAALTALGLRPRLAEFR